LRTNHDGHEKHPHDTVLGTSATFPQFAKLAEDVVTDVVVVGAGVIADWYAVFASAAARGVAIEIDGDPARQDVDHTLATQALEAGCLFALDSDAHTIAQLSYAETAVAHARLAGIPTERIVNCWPLEQLLAWLAAPTSVPQ
jgi:hypothetical protein